MTMRRLILAATVITALPIAAMAQNPLRETCSQGDALCFERNAERDARDQERRRSREQPDYSIAHNCSASGGKAECVTGPGQLGAVPAGRTLTLDCQMWGDRFMVDNKDQQIPPGATFEVKNYQPSGQTFALGHEMTQGPCTIVLRTAPRGQRP
jgi:hypothetical protein